MTLSQSKLATELENLVPTSDASAAVQEMADAYGTYMADAQSNAETILTVTTAVTAMKNAMTFPVPGTAAGAGAVFQAGVQAFWDVIFAAPVTHFATATGITLPPNLGDLGGDLETTFGSNVGKSLADSAAAMAADIHAVSVGGFAIFPPTPPGTSLPIT